MAAVLPICAILLSAAATARGSGTIMQAFNARGSTSAKTFPSGSGVASTWVTFNPIQSSSGAPPGCVNLPESIQGNVLSFEIFWNATSGTDQCNHLWFFYDLNCANVEDHFVVSRGTADSVIRYGFSNQDPLHFVNWAVSLACSYSSDPCADYPCTIPSTTCSSTLPNTAPYKDPLMGAEYSSQTRICTCPAGLVLANGTCVVAPPPPPPVWMPLLNAFRAAQNPSAAPLVWDPSLAAQAQAQADNLKSQLCNTFLTSGPSSTLLQQSRVKTTTLSEDNTWILSAPTPPTEQSAAKVWTASPAKAPAARISSSKTVTFGCAKSLCGSYSYFFVCFFSPFTY